VKTMEATSGFILKTNLMENCYSHTEKLPQDFKINWLAAHQKRTQVELRGAPRLLVSGRTRSTSTSPCAATTRLLPHALYVDLAVRRNYSSPAARALRRPRRAPRVLAFTLPAATVYLDYAARPGASARRAARHAARRAARRRLLLLAQARRRLLRLRRASGCLGTSRGSSRGSSSTTSPTPRVWVPRHVARLIACRQPLRLRRASGCLGTSRGSSRGSLRRSSSTTSPTSRVRVPRHVARPVTRLIVDYSVRRDFVLQPHWLYFSHAVRGDYLSRGNIGSTSSTPHAATAPSSGRIASTIHLD
jgi:hypothetical protein